MFICIFFKALANWVILYGYKINKEFDSNRKESASNKKFLFEHSREFKASVDFPVIEESMVYLYLTKDEYKEIMHSGNDVLINSYIKKLEESYVVPSHRNITYRRRGYMQIFNNRGLVPFTTEKTEGCKWRKTLESANVPRFTTNLELVKSEKDFFKLLE